MEARISPRTKHGKQAQIESKKKIEKWIMNPTVTKSI